MTSPADSPPLSSTPATSAFSQVASRWIFLRSVAFIYLIAFASLHGQIPGLIGDRGILPAKALLNAAHLQLGAGAWRLLPSVFWFGASNAVLSGAAIVGMLFAALALLDLAPAFSFWICWLLYVSYMAVAGDFLSFQWDALLVETGFLAIFYSPLTIRPTARGGRPSPVIGWLLRLLLFRLMFMSGLVKILSGDRTWRMGEALRFHYETQPLPFWASWYAHHLPVGFQHFSTWAVLFIELVLPPLLLAPARVRRVVCWIFIAFQGLILITGNYGFFNLLAIGLCFGVLDDGAWPAALRRALSDPRDAGRLEWPRAVTIAVAVLIGALTVAALWPRVTGRRAPLGLAPIHRALAPLGLVNSYGLFAVMTTERPEIIVEGSYDGQSWSQYDFKYKPDELDQRPALVTPHMPRLDWQMWFAALGGLQDNRWFLNFCVRLLQGSPDVLALMAPNTFPDGPPKYIRARLYRYRFSTPDERRQDGAWWEREEIGTYCPPFSLDDLRKSVGGR